MLRRAVAGEPHMPASGRNARCALNVGWSVGGPECLDLSGLQDEALGGGNLLATVDHAGRRDEATRQDGVGCAGSRLFGGARAQLLKSLFAPGSRGVGAETRRRNDAQRLDQCGAGDDGLLVEQKAAKTLGFGLVN
jgi:hypothetical protein